MIENPYGAIRIHSPDGWVYCIPSKPTVVTLSNRQITIPEHKITISGFGSHEDACEAYEQIIRTFGPIKVVR